MNRPQIIRWLRMSASGVCLVVCILLMVLWDRSYVLHEGGNWRCSSLKVLGLGTGQGVLHITLHWNMPRVPKEKLAHFFQQLPAEFFRGGGTKPTLLPFALIKSDNIHAQVPIWLLAVLAAACACVPWLPWYRIPWSTRFSLRTLLLVMTLVSMLLGLVMVWIER